MSLYDYSRWPNFTEEELNCSFTGKENPNIIAFTQLMDRVQSLRDRVGIPFKVTSGYRDKSHPNEVHKTSGGMHTKAAIDIQVPVEYCHRVLRLAFELGFTGVGVNLAGDHKYRFIHLDLREAPRVWSYK